MKYFFNLIFLTTLCFAKAQNNARIYSADGSVFTLYLNDKPCSKFMQASLVLENIAQDTLYLKAEFEKKPRLGFTIYLMDQGKPVSGKELNYKIRNREGKLNVEFTGIYDILALPAPLIPDDPARKNPAATVKSGELVELRNGSYFFPNHLPVSGDCNKCMSAAQAGQAGELMMKESQQEKKIEIAQGVCSNNCLCVDQLMDLISHIDYEVEKLKIALIGYGNLADTMGKYRLMGSFRFDSSKARMQELFATVKHGTGTPPQGCSVASASAEVNEFARITGAFENDGLRMDLFRKKYAQYCYDAEQCLLVLGKFNHDREKLEAAKLIYTRCTQKNRFGEVTQLFSFAQSTSELNTFLSEQQK